MISSSTIRNNVHGELVPEIPSTEQLLENLELENEGKELVHRYIWSSANRILLLLAIPSRGRSCFSRD